MEGFQPLNNKVLSVWGGSVVPSRGGISEHGVWHFVSYPAPPPGCVAESRHGSQTSTDILGSVGLTHSTLPTVQGRDVNSATNIRHALVEMLLGHKRPASLQTGGGGGIGGGGGGSSGGACAHLGSGGGGKGHVEEESAAPPKKRRKRAG